MLEPLYLHACSSQERQHVCSALPNQHGFTTACTTCKGTHTINNVPIPIHVRLQAIKVLQVDYAVGVCLSAGLMGRENERTATSKTHSGSCQATTIKTAPAMHTCNGVLVYWWTPYMQAWSTGNSDKTQSNMHECTYQEVDCSVVSALTYHTAANQQPA